MVIKRTCIGSHFVLYFCSENVIYRKSLLQISDVLFVQPFSFRLPTVFLLSATHYYLYPLSPRPMFYVCRKLSGFPIQFSLFRIFSPIHFVTLFFQDIYRYLSIYIFFLTRFFSVYVLSLIYI